MLNGRFRWVGVVMLALFALVGWASPFVAASPSSPTTSSPDPSAGSSSAGSGADELARLEQRFDARLGVYALDTGNGAEIEYNAGERFAYASTHKAFSTGVVLQHNTVEGLNRRVTYSESDLVPHSPITEQHVDTGMTVREVMDAAVRYSDNTAANLLFRELGGPSELQAALRSLGDETIHADRIETALNETSPGDVRDTSTPRAMAETLRKFTLGDALPREKRAILNEMLRTAQLTEDLIRAGVPADWEVGDKSGSADYGTRNDIAVIRPPGKAPIMLAVMSDRKDKDAEYDDALIAEAARVVVEDLSSPT